MSTYLTLIAVGNLGRDPEMKFTPSGSAVCNFSIAVNRQYNAPDGTQVKETTWLRCNVWGKAGEACNKILKKGQKVLIEGRLNPNPKTGGPRIWEGKDGPAASYEVTAMTVRFLERAGEAVHGDEEEGGYGGETEGDIPF